MDRPHLRRRTHVRLALIADDLVGHAEFLQQPQHALGAGVVEMMDGQHGEFPGALGDVRSADLVAAGGKVGDWTEARARHATGLDPAQEYYTRVILTSKFT